MRPKEFVPDEVLDKAVELFWRQGYDATSLQDLIDHMGIKRGSIYNAFGDKHQLFLAAMERYIDQVVTQRLEIFNTPGSTKDVLRTFFDGVADYAMNDTERRGWLITNTTVELLPHDSDAADKVMANLARWEDAFYRLLVRAQVAPR